jgi:hypothetical protein
VHAGVVASSQPISAAVERDRQARSWAPASVSKLQTVTSAPAARDRDHHDKALDAISHYPS